MTNPKPDFRIAAEIYAAHRITAVLPPPEAVLSTPEARSPSDLNASGGIVISAATASNDNGSEFYHGHGVSCASSRPDPGGHHRRGRARGADARSIGESPPDSFVRSASRSANYIAANIAAVARLPVLDSRRIHSTAWNGPHLRRDVLEAAGVPVTLSQSSRPDGRFPTVPFKSPNPRALRRSTCIRRLKRTASISYGL